MTAPDDMNAVKAASGAPPSDASAQSAVPPLPADALIVLPTRNLVLFPGTYTAAAGTFSKAEALDTPSGAISSHAAQPME